jgi:Flp pilus assembly protein TadD
LPPAHATAADAGQAKANPPAALAAQGYVALNHRQYPQAISLFKRALAGSPSNGTALFGLAEAYRGSGQASQALQSYRRYIQILPLGPDAGSARFQVRTLESKRR